MRNIFQGPNKINKKNKKPFCLYIWYFPRKTPGFFKIPLLLFPLYLFHYIYPFYFPFFPFPNEVRLAVYWQIWGILWTVDCFNVIAPFHGIKYGANGYFIFFIANKIIKRPPKTFFVMVDLFIISY